MALCKLFTSPNLPYAVRVPPGIVTHHVAYTLLFEQAMQRIAPSVSIPYWEYTIEGTMSCSRSFRVGLLNLRNV